jgi:cobyric acid synthase
MFQGTASNAGKSVLTAACCRILLQDGYRVAPFKAQNMSLNSYVTRDGGEMGRAQVVQAQACRRDPDVRMNPVLLKPNSTTGAQAILLGKPVGNMEVGRYIRYKQQAFEAVKQAYDSLASEVDVVVLEGAGSPGEVNLKRHDIVNMTMAEHANAPVLLVGDIDRGGVFAAFVGTMEVLSERERRRIAGFVINRFRGDPALLDEAIDYTQQHTGVPTVDVVPYIVATRARHVASDLSLKGYEIHHGRTTAAGDARPAVIRDDGEVIGFCSADGRILGTYLHGLFDADGFRRWFIDRLRTRRGLAPIGIVQTVYDIEPALERLADQVRSHLDMKAVYWMMGLK